MNWPAFFTPIALSLKVACLSTVLVVIFGMIAARLLSRRIFPGKTVVETAFLLPLVLPPTVVGFMLLVLLGRKSPVGQWIERAFDAPIIFSWWAAVIASVVVSFPLVYQTMKAGFASVDPDIEGAARSDGAGEWHVFRRITLPLTFRSVVTAVILAFARGLGEFGATLMIAGNIPGKTQTIPTAIYVAVDAGNMTVAWAWAGTMIVLSFILLLFTRTKKE